MGYCRVITWITANRTLAFLSSRKWLLWTRMWRMSCWNRWNRRPGTKCGSRVSQEKELVQAAKRNSSQRSRLVRSKHLLFILSFSVFFGFRFVVFLFVCFVFVFAFYMGGRGGRGCLVLQTGGLWLKKKLDDCSRRLSTSRGIIYTIMIYWISNAGWNCNINQTEYTKGYNVYMKWTIQRKTELTGNDDTWILTLLRLQKSLNTRLIGRLQGENWTKLLPPKKRPNHSEETKVYIHDIITCKRQRG